MLNDYTKRYWEAYWKRKEQHPPLFVETVHFGAEADWLADLVVAGKKTATCSAYELYEIENTPLPEVGQHCIVLNSQEEPVAIIEITDVQIKMFDEITEAFALAEGEGTYEEWRATHRQFFEKAFKLHNLNFNGTTKIVCEYFKVLYA